MRFDLSQVVTSYTGQPFSRPVEGGEGQEPLTLKYILESLCLGADPAKYSTGGQKMVIFNVLMKIHQAPVFVDLSAEDVALLKDLAGMQLSIAAVGAVHGMLERPNVIRDEVAKV